MRIISSFKDTGQLLKNTFVIIGKNREIFKPTKTLILIYMGFYLTLLFSFIGAILSLGPMRWILLMFGLISLIILVPLSPYIKTYYGAAQCWLVYNTFAGKNLTYKDGIQRAKQNKKDIFVLGTFDLILTVLANHLKQGTKRNGLFGAFLSGLMWLIGKTIEEGWDLIGHYLLPAAIINDKSVADVLPDIPKIKNNVPGALAGTFAVDFVGDLFIGYINIFFFLLLFCLAFIAAMNNAFLILFLIALLVVIGINFILKILVGMVKTIYFTLFYTSIMLPMKISPNYRSEVTNYLTYYAKKPEDKEKNIKKLRDFITQYRAQGYTDADIKKFLIKKGWPEQTVSDTMKD